MMPTEYSFEIYRGDDWSEDFLINQPRAQLTDPAVPMDFTGFTAAAQVKATATDVIEEALMTITFAANRLTGIFTAELAADAIDVGTHVYDIQLTNAAGKKQTYIYGTITVRQDVTRP